MITIQEAPITIEEAPPLLKRLPTGGPVSYDISYDISYDVSMTSLMTCPAHLVAHHVAHPVWHLQSHVVSHLVIAMSRCLCQTQTVASSCIASSHSYNLATCSHVGISVSMTFRIKKSQLPIRSPPGCTDRHRHILVEVSRFKRMKSTIVA